MSHQDPTVPYAKQIDYIIKHFDFRKIQHLMEVLGWRWLLPSGARGVPDVRALKRAARYHLRQACKVGIVASSSGGLHARNQKGWLALAFEADATEARDYFGGA